MVPKSILIRCAKCQIFGIWHTKHQKQSIMRCAKCAKILRHATVRSHLWHSLDENAICVYYFFIHLSLSSQLKYIIIFTFSHSFFASPSPFSHTLFFSLLPFFSILFSFMNHEPPPISSLPSHKFHHHWSILSPSPVFPPLFSLSPQWSMISYVERRRPPRLATDHWPTLRQKGTPMWRTWWPEVKTSISDGDKGSCPDLIVALER